jgi:hypothetical protein
VQEISPKSAWSARNLDETLGSCASGDDSTRDFTASQFEVPPPTTPSSMTSEVDVRASVADIIRPNSVRERRHLA